MRRWVWAVGSQPCILLPDDQTPVEIPMGGPQSFAHRWEEGLEPGHSRTVGRG